MRKPLVLITGASHGIGRAMAGVFAREGYDLVLVSRNKKELSKVSDELEARFRCRTWICAQDLSAPDGPQKVVRFIDQQKLMLDVLVNNAGFGSYGVFSEQKLEVMLNMIDVNVRALTELTGLILPGMLKRKKGKILQVASTGAFQPGPLSAVYFATKSYVLHFSEALGNELEESGVTVTTLCPGPTNTGFSARAEWDSLMFAFAFSPERVAELGFKGLMKGVPVVYACSWVNRFLIWCERLVSRSIMVKLTRRVMER